MAALG
jgi:hypothetical protein